MLTQPVPSIAFDLRESILWEAVSQSPCNEVELSLLAPMSEIPSGAHGLPIFIEEWVFEDVGVGGHGWGSPASSRWH